MSSLSSFATWLYNALVTLCVHLYNYFVDAVNAMIAGLSAFAAYLSGILPTYTVPSPGSLVDNIGFLNALNWVLPISFFVDCLAMLVAAYAAYHVFGPVLRWVKVLR